MSRRAEFAVLVTSGTKRGFNGLDEMYDVLIVAPAGVLPLAGLLRTHLVANKLLTFIKSPEFRNPIEEVVHIAQRLRHGVEEEFRWHRNDWDKRLAAYERIRWDVWAIQENLHRVLRGEATQQMLQRKQKLALPAPADTLMGELGTAKVHAAKAGT